MGVPVAAVAALWGARQDKARKSAAADAAEADDAEGGGGQVATFVGSPGLNAGAPGIGADQIAQFTEVFTGELGAIEQRLEEEFGQSAAERAAAAAANEARFADLEERIGEAAQRPAPTPRPADPVPLPMPKPTTPAPTPPPSSSKTITYTVVRGDSLRKIAARFYGTESVWRSKIYEPNKSVIGPNPDLIKPGQRLVLAGVK